MFVSAITYLLALNFLLCKSQICPSCPGDKTDWRNDQKSHLAKQLSDASILKLARKADRGRFLRYLTPIAIPRIAGTAGNDKVRAFIETTLRSLGYTVERDRFIANPPAPHAARFMTNIVATLNPSAPRQLVLACHHDSKYEASGTFIGATDSAVPCAMMLDIAASLAGTITNNEVTLQFIFFDGEEAFNTWNAQDSIYGSRNLVEKFKTTPHPVPIASSNLKRHHGMDMMILLDLIGTSDTQIKPIFTNTHKHFQRLSKIEGLLTQYREIKLNNNNKVYFANTRPFGFNIVDDDHRPWLHAGVPIMHLVSYPFPSVWHKRSDNLDALDGVLIDDILKIIRVFTCEYLHCNA